MKKREEIISILCYKLGELLGSENYDPDELYCILDEIEDEDDNNDWEEDEDEEYECEDNEWDDYCDCDDSGDFEHDFGLDDCLFYLLDSYYPYNDNFKRTGRDESYLDELKEKGVDFLIPFLKEIPESDVKEYLLDNFED